MENKKCFFPLVLPLILLVSTMSSCGSASSPTSTPQPPAPAAPAQGEEAAISIELTSAAFAPGASIPTKYTCDGDDISPPLEWGDPPQDTQSFALVADDPDAPGGMWVHWVLYNLPSETRALPEAVPPDAELSDGSRHGQNSWKRLDYGGPCPPSGTHRYFFKLYALDTLLDPDAIKDNKQLLQAMEGHILAQTELMGTYSR